MRLGLSNVMGVEHIDRVDLFILQNRVALAIESLELLEPSYAIQRSGGIQVESSLL